MRRKLLLLAILAIFTLSGWLSGVFLRETAVLVPDEASSLIVKNEAQPKSEHTITYDTKKMLSVKIANPVGQEMMASRPVIKPVPEKSEDTVATDIEVPLTSSPSNSEIITRWRRIVFQTSSALFVGAVVCILIALLKRYFTHL